MAVGEGISTWRIIFNDTDAYASSQRAFKLSTQLFPIDSKRGQEQKNIPTDHLMLARAKPHIKPPLAYLFYRYPNV